MEEQEKSDFEENFPEYLDWSNAFEVLEKAQKAPGSGVRKL